MRLVLASNNAAKLVELQALLAPIGVELVAQGELGIAEADEPHSTFIENALAKARHAARASGEAAIADDSGLCVDALGGAPGVASAHFAAVPATQLPGGATPADRADGVSPRAEDRESRRRRQDAANNRLLVTRLAAIDDRRARFVSTLVAVRHADDPEPLVATGRWEATVVLEPRGAGGFGYDPHVYIVGLGRTVAELDAATKSAHSHRARAATLLRDLMRSHWPLLPPASAKLLLPEAPARGG